jgi:thioredoxin-related protein
MVVKMIILNIQNTCNYNMQCKNGIFKIRKYQTVFRKIYVCSLKSKLKKTVTLATAGLGARGAAV